MEIRPGIHWIGVRDPDLEIFDVIIPTEYGTTYNSLTSLAPSLRSAKIGS